MALPEGMPDPIFLCELALELKMPVGELGERMSAHELHAIWPAYYRHKHRENKRAQEKAEAKKRRR